MRRTDKILRTIIFFLKIRRVHINYYSNDATVFVGWSSCASDYGYVSRQRFTAVFISISWTVLLNMLGRHAAVLLFLVRSISAYLLVVSDTDSPGLVLFDGGTPFYDRPARRYALNSEKSGDFVSRLLRVDHYTGSVILERPLECDGFKYPDVFTFYVDSTSNDTLEYMSVPLRMVIKGCEKNSEFNILPRYLPT